MRVEVKKITYTPDQYDDEGDIKKEAFFAVALQIPNTPEVRELLADVMLAGQSDFKMEIEPIQGVIPEVKEDIQELKNLGVTEVKRG